MPISATGNNRPPPGEYGFTLVELMVVMVIIGLMTAAVIVTMPDPRGSVSGDAQGFAARLTAARDLAITGGRDIGVRVDATGYGFSQRRAAGWEAVPDKALFPRNWGEGIGVLTDIEGDAALVFDTTGLATPAVVTLQRDGAAARVSVDAAGAVRIDAQ